MSKKPKVKKIETTPAVFTLEHPSASQPATPEIVNLVPDTLTESEKTFGLELQAKYPEVVAAAQAVASEEQTMARKYFQLADALRKTGLNGREMTLLMASLGYRKQRITEIKKAISVADDVWEKYKGNVIGFKAVLAIARAPVPAPVPASPPVPGEGEGEPSPTPSPARVTTIHPVASDVMEALSDVLAAAIGEGHFAPVGTGYYQMEYSVNLPHVEGETRKTRKVLVSFEVSESEVK